MKKRTAIITAVVAIIALAVVPFVYAQARHRAAGFGMFGHLAGIKTALGLTDQQVTDLKAIRTDLKAQNAPYRAQLRTGLAAVAQALITNPNDVAGAQALIDQQAAARKAVQVNTLNAVSKALNVLTPDQRTKLGQLLQQRLAKQQGWMGKHEDH
jgi:Spy/CpxP family protein refolding chaperone